VRNALFPVEGYRLNGFHQLKAKATELVGTRGVDAFRVKFFNDFSRARNFRAGQAAQAVKNNSNYSIGRGYAFAERRPSGPRRDHRLGWLTCSSRSDAINFVALRNPMICVRQFARLRCLRRKQAHVVGHRRLNSQGRRSPHERILPLARAMSVHQRRILLRSGRVEKLASLHEDGTLACPLQPLQQLTDD
jgi:hypothetical protein